jgi:hypothetical protein
MVFLKILPIVAHILLKIHRRYIRMNDNDPDRIAMSWSEGGSKVIGWFVVVVFVVGAIGVIVGWLFP